MAGKVSSERSATTALRWADLVAVASDADIRAAVSPEMIELLSLLGQEARALQHVEALGARPLAQGTALVALAGQRLARGELAGAETLFSRAASVFDGVQRTHPNAAITALALEALARRDQRERALDLASQAREQLRDPASPAGPALALVVHAYVELGEIETALDLYAGREPQHDASALRALLRALTASGDVERLCRLARFVPAHGEHDLDSALVSFAAARSAADCEALAAAAPKLAARIWAAHVDGAIAAGDLPGARAAMPALERHASHRALIERWHALGEHGARDDVLALMRGDVLPWDARRGEPEARAPALALCGRLDLIEAALAADAEVASLRAGRGRPSYHTTLGSWQNAIIGGSTWRGALDAADTSGSAANVGRVLGWATELARVEPASRLRPRRLGELAAALHRIGRKEESARVFDEGLATALALRGRWSGYPVRSTALVDLCGIALSAGLPERALAIGKRLGRGLVRDMALQGVLDEAVRRNDASLGVRTVQLFAPGHRRIYVITRALGALLGASLVLRTA